MKYSRIYEFTLAGAIPEIVMIAAPSDSSADDAHVRLFDQLRSTFHTHSRRQFGYFDPMAGAVACAAISDYHKHSLNSEQLGLLLANHFKSCLNATDQPPICYLWFIIEQSGDDVLLYLFLMVHDESYYISSQLGVTDGNSISPARLQYCAKINVTEWLGGQSQAYLSYMTLKNQQPLTLAWNAFIGFAEGIDRAAKTEEFLSVIERYTSELPPEKEQDYRERVVDYCMDQNRLGEPVEIDALSRHVDEEAPEALMHFLKDRIEAPTQAIYTDRKQLKRYTRFYGRDQDLSIGFSTAMLGRHIVYDENTDTLTIRAIPKALKSQLAQHFKKSD